MFSCRKDWKNKFAIHLTWIRTCATNERNTNPKFQLYAVCNALKTKFNTVMHLQTSVCTVYQVFQVIAFVTFDFLVL